jgi:PEP-CTERM motif
MNANTRSHGLRAAAALLSLCAATAAHADFGFNGSFENPGFAVTGPSDNFRFLANGDFTTVANWTVADDGIGEMPYVFHRTRYGVHDGDYAVALNQGSAISTQVVLNAGTVYEVTAWMYAGNGPLNLPPDPLVVSWGDVSTTWTDTFMDGQYHLYTFRFTATDGDANPLRFANVSAPGDYKGYALDGVTLAAVPEPAPLALFAGGLAGLWWRARARAPRRGTCRNTQRTLTMNSSRFPGAARLAGHTARLLLSTAPALPLCAAAQSFGVQIEGTLPGTALAPNAGLVARAGDCVVNPCVEAAQFHTGLLSGVSSVGVSGALQRSGSDRAGVEFAQADATATASARIGALSALANAHVSSTNTSGVEPFNNDAYVGFNVDARDDIWLLSATLPAGTAVNVRFTLTPLATGALRVHDGRVSQRRWQHAPRAEQHRRNAPHRTWARPADPGLSTITGA